MKHKRIFCGIYSARLWRYPNYRQGSERQSSVKATIGKGGAFVEDGEYVRDSQRRVQVAEISEVISGGQKVIVACGPYGSKNSFASGPGLKDLEFKHMEVRIQVWWKELVGRGLDEFLTGRNLAGQRQHLLGGRCITSTNGGNSAVVSSNQLQLIHSIC